MNLCPSHPPSPAVHVESQGNTALVEGRERVPPAGLTETLISPTLGLSEDGIPYWK